MSMRRKKGKQYEEGKKLSRVAWENKNIARRSKAMKMKFKRKATRSEIRVVGRKNLSTGNS